MNRESQIASICQNFEREWLAGRDPRIEEYLKEATEQDQPQLLEELLQIEWQVLERRQLKPQVAEYQRRFPAVRDIVETLYTRLFEESGGGSQSTREPSLESTWLGSNESDLLLPLKDGSPGSAAGVSTAADTANSGAERRIPLRQLGPYVIDKFLGRGAFGNVYRASGPQGQTVAIKVLHPDRQQDATARSLFDQEAETLARLHHPAIVRFIEAFTAETGHRCLVTEFLSGGTLACRMDDIDRSPTAVARFIAVLADALHQMHLAGFTHRDIKPDNILLDRAGQPQLADVGLALSDEAYGCGVRQIIGSLAYLSPEQARGDAHLVDGRSDIYSLGLVMYELLTGRRPFRADNPSELLRCIQEVDIKPPRQFRAEIPRELEAICLKATAREATQRYSTAGDLADELRRFSHAQSTRRRFWKVAVFSAAILLPAGLWIARDGSLSAIWSASSSSESTRTRSTRPDNSQTETAPSTPAPPRPGPVEVTRFDVLLSRTDSDFTRIEQVGSLQPGDAIRFSIELDQPAYIKLYWIDSTGTPLELYPHDPEQGDRGSQPVQRLESPESIDRGWPFRPTGADEFAVLLVRRTPFAEIAFPRGTWQPAEPLATDTVRRYIASQTLRPSLSNSADLDATRALDTTSQQIADPILNYLEQLRNQTDAIHAIRIPIAPDSH